jgi:hypothetical protein
MRRIAALSVVVAASFSAVSQAAVLYSSGIQSYTGGPGTGSVIGVVGPITGGPNFSQGFGDDYTTIGGTTGTVTMTKFVFAGGVSVANGALGFEFFNPDGSDSNQGFAVQLASAGTKIWTITLSTPVVIPSSGFVILQPVIAGVLTGVPGSTATFGQGNVVDVGSNDLTITAATTDANVLSTGAFINSGPQLLAFEIQGNPVPEPTAALAAAPAVMLLGRRRRA